VKGSYEKDGETKKAFVKIGTVMKSDDKPAYMLLDPTFNYGAFPRPEGRDMLMISFFKPKEKEEDIPF
jgi:hypothetical protein